MPDIAPVTWTGEPLPAYTSYGCYPLVYLTAKNEVLCAACASQDRTDDHPGPAVAHGVHWEGEPLECDACWELMESAYGIPDDEAAHG